MKQFVILLTLAVTVMVASSAEAFVWIEQDHGDAGMLPATAQVITGTGPLERIRGRIANLPGVDMYQIWVAGNEMVSVGVGSADFDAQLFVFDSDGYGVTGNDDRADDDDRPRLPATFVPPEDAGIYFLAISRYDRDPRNELGRIFKNLPKDAIHDADGPGASDPIERWTSSDEDGSGPYVINLRGVYGVNDTVVPEPASMALLGLGLAGIFLRRKKKGLIAVKFTNERR